MSIFRGAWEVTVLYHEETGGRIRSDVYNGVDINDFNGGDPAEFIISAIPVVEAARVVEDAARPGGTSVDFVDLASFRIDPATWTCRTSEIRVDATTAGGEPVTLVICPAYAVEDTTNGFDVHLDDP